MTRFWYAALIALMSGCSDLGKVDTGDTAGAGIVDVGRVLYETNCQGCHGVSGEGGLGVALNDGLLATLSDERIAEVIRDGLPPGMPGFSASLTEDEIASLIDFLRANFDN